jgi:hypothetical protein
MFDTNSSLIDESRENVSNRDREEIVNAFARKSEKERWNNRRI